MPINANVTNNQITASVSEDKIDATVSGGFGPSGAAGAAATITVGTVTTGAPGTSASVVNAGTSSAAVLNFTIPAGAAGATGPQGATGPAGTTSWAGITDKPSTFAPSTHAHVAADISDFTSAVVAAAPPTTDASLLTSGTLPDARLSANIARTSDVSSAVASLVNSSPAALDTLGELAAALGSDANFSTTVTNALAGKAATSHAHGFITSSGAIGTTPDRLVMTGSGGVLVANAAPAITVGGIGCSSIVATGSISTSLGVSANGVETSGSSGVTVTGGAITQRASGTFVTQFNVSNAGIVTVGQWQATAIAVAYGGTGATTASAARTNLGLVIGTDVAAVSHEHSALAVTSGQFDIARIPTGTTSTTVALGDHTHTQLHDRSHAVTSTSDHTATAWRVFYSNGSGNVTELALGASGTVLTSGGASAAPSFATPAGGTPTVASPSQITSNQNDYAGATADINRLSSDAARDITGFSGGTDGKTLVLVNVGSNTITLKHQDSGSSAGNRIIVPWAADYILAADGAAVLVYDNTTSRWRVI